MNDYLSSEQPFAEAADATYPEYAPHNQLPDFDVDYPSNLIVAVAMAMMWVALNPSNGPISFELLYDIRQSARAALMRQNRLLVHDALDDYIAQRDLVRTMLSVRAGIMYLAEQIVSVDNNPVFKEDPVTCHEMVSMILTVKAWADDGTLSVRTENGVMNIPVRRDGARVPDMNTSVE